MRCPELFAWDLFSFFTVDFGFSGALRFVDLPNFIGTQKNTKLRIATQNDVYRVMPVGARGRVAVSST
ncbi:hypothetical protein PsAD5_00555 [Pseudovibrio sp. Ad5]|nr:hypothetical protein PsAD5_00555 [Pseudovibrio sp. Ad5]